MFKPAFGNKLIHFRLFLHLADQSDHEFQVFI